VITGRRHPAPTAFIAGSPRSATNERLHAAVVDAGVYAVVGPSELAEQRERPGDVVIGRLDVRPTLDGVQPGLGRLVQVPSRGIRIVNDADALVATHDKLATTLLLDAASIPQPRAAWATDAETSPAFDPPYVVKPRFGSCGRDVNRCESRTELRACLLRLSRRPWFLRHGALVQELIPPQGFDVRLACSRSTPPLLSEASSSGSICFPTSAARAWSRSAVRLISPTSTPWTARTSSHGQSSRSSRSRRSTHSRRSTR
jgi:hypothetical protein